MEHHGGSIFVWRPWPWGFSKCDDYIAWDKFLIGDFFFLYVRICLYVKRVQYIHYLVCTLNMLHEASILFLYHLLSLYSLIRDFLLSQINIWTTTTWSNVWVILPKPSWYEFLIGFLIWTPASKYLHLTTFSNIRVILSMFLYL